MKIDPRVEPFVKPQSALFQIDPIPQEYLQSPEGLNRYLSETYHDWTKRIELGIQNHPKGAEPFNLLKTYGLVQTIREYLQEAETNEQQKLGLRAFVEALEQDKQMG